MNKTQKIPKHWEVHVWQEGELVEVFTFPTEREARDCAREFPEVGDTVDVFPR